MHKGSNLKPGYVPWQGIEPVTFQGTGQWSNQPRQLPGQIYLFIYMDTCTDCIKEMVGKTADTWAQIRTVAPT